jgi:UDP-glucose 4-epimerase
MKVLVTGGTGSVGTAAVRWLAEKGYTVTVIGRREGISIPDARYEPCDMLDYRRLRKAVRGHDAIVHLAAIPNPAQGTPEEIFRANCAGTFNVYQAASEEGIRRVVSASSINAVGYYYGAKEFELSYLPVDEAHPSFTTDAYSFSKQVLEEIAAYFWRRESISGVSLRFPWVYHQTEAHLEVVQGQIRWAQDYLPKLFVLDETERKALLLRLKEKVRKGKADGLQEKRSGWSSVLSDDERRLFAGQYNLWTFVDACDAAQAVEKGITADYRGSHPLFINDDNNTAGVESAMLAKILYPEVEIRKGKLVGTESFVSIEKAKALIGFEPRYSVRRFYV